MYKEILDKVKEYNRIIVHMHIRPDGDCYGSAFGLKYIIQETYPQKEVYVVGEKSNYVSFVGEVDDIDDELYKGSLVIVVDTANKDRISDQRYNIGDFLIKIDHHILVDSYGDIELVLTDRPAASQIILEFFNENSDELKMNNKAAIALFTGIVTDSGRFKYRNVSGDTYRQVASLLDFGFDFSYVFSRLDIKSENMLKFKGYVLQNYKKTENGVAYIKLYPEIINDHNISLEEATSLVNELSVLEDCPIWMLFAEYENNIVRARIRSKGPHIDKLANKYLGGGHKLACGANVRTWENSDNLIKDADELARKYKNGELD